MIGCRHHTGLLGSALAFAVVTVAFACAGADPPGHTFEVIDQDGVPLGVNSPTPISGKDGDVEGLWLADLKGSDNDMVFAEDLDPIGRRLRLRRDLHLGDRAGIDRVVEDPDEPVEETAEETGHSPAPRFSFSGRQSRSTASVGVKP